MNSIVNFKLLDTFGHFSIACRDCLADVRNLWKDPDVNKAGLWIFITSIFMALSHGAETMAYRFAAAPAISTPLAELPLLKQVANPTLFIAAGDVVYDLTSVFCEDKGLLENSWVVWNQTQRLLVVHGVMQDQWRVEELAGFREQSQNAKLTIDLIRSEKPEALPAKNPPVFASLGLTGKSGMKSSASTKIKDPNGQWSFSVDAEHTIGHDAGLFVRLNFKWKEPNGGNEQHGNLFVATSIANEMTLPVASWYVAGHGSAWQLYATAETLLSDGSSWSKARLRQDGENITICRPMMSSSGWSAVREGTPKVGRKLLVRMFSSELFRDFAALPSDPDNTVDPFAEKQKLLPAPLRNLPFAVIPNHLKDCFTNPPFDLRELLRESGVVLESDDFVVYDPIAEKLFIDCKSDRVIDLIEALFFQLGISPPANVECTISLAEAVKPESAVVQISLLTKSGMKAPFQLFNEKGQPIVTFEGETTVGEDSRLVDLRYDFRCRLQHPTNLEWHSETALTLANGVPVWMNATKLSDGRTLKQGLQARVVPENPPGPE